MEKSPLILPPRPPRDPAWGIVDVVVLGAGTFVAINILAGIFLVPILIAQNFPHGQSVPLTLVAKAAIPAELLAYILLILVAKQVLVARGYPSLLKAMHWNWPARRNAAALLLLGIATAWLANAISRHIDIPPDAPILEMMKDRMVVEMFLLFGILVAPFAEEFYFRGLLYPALQRRIGTIAAVLLTSVLFALIHASQLANSLGPVFVLLIVGIILTSIRARTGSLAASFIFHIAYNSALFIGSLVMR